MILLRSTDERIGRAVTLFDHIKGNTAKLSGVHCKGSKSLVPDRGALGRLRKYRVGSEIVESEEREDDEDDEDEGDEDLTDGTFLGISIAKQRDTTLLLASALVGISDRKHTICRRFIRTCFFNVVLQHYRVCSVLSIARPLG